MRSAARQRVVLAFAGVCILALLALGVYLYDRGPRDLIAPGVRVGRVDIGGLRVGAARARLAGALEAMRLRTIAVRAGGRRFTLSGCQADVNANVEALVGEAVKASRSGSILIRTVRGLLGERLDEDIPIRISYSRRAIVDFVARASAGVDRPPRDASVTVSDDGTLIEVPSHRGVAVDSALLSGEIERALDGPRDPQTIAAPLHALEPRVRTSMLVARYPAYIVVDRQTFTLRFYSHLRLTHTYPIAVRMQGLQTPPGLHHILDKEVNPAWRVPNSAWAGSLAGRVIPPGPDDPLVARWMGIDARATASTAPTRRRRSARGRRTAAFGCSSPRSSSSTA